MFQILSIILFLKIKCAVLTASKFYLIARFAHFIYVYNILNGLKKQYLINTSKIYFIYILLHIYVAFQTFITFFYVNRRKYWFRANFRLPFFDRFTRFGMSWTRFDYFWKMSVCESVCVFICVSVCVFVKKKFVASVARELMHSIIWNFIFSDIVT